LEKTLKNNLLSNFPDFDQIIEGLDSDLLEDFATFYEESRFGLTLILEDLSETGKDADILEIGSGIGLLSRYLASQGFKVTSIEPAGKGFGMMLNLQEHVNKFFGSTNYKYVFNRSSIEDFNPKIKYDFIFSINVFEHIKDPLEGLRKTYSLLEKRGIARIVTPNYGIPYEPHFNIPIILGKKFTHMIFRTRIQTFRCYDPIGLWESLNWISISKVRRMLISESISGHFGYGAMDLYFGRLRENTRFLARKGLWFKYFATKVKFFLRFLPPRFYPILDLKITIGGQIKSRKCGVYV